MRFISKSLVWISALTVLAVACGPDFGLEVLTNRKEYLLAPPTVSFERVLTSLVPAPQDHLPVVEPYVSNEPTTREQFETQEASSLGTASRSAAMQLYAAGAASFQNGQLEASRQSFEKLLSLPRDQRGVREVWAHFMLGRLASQLRDRPESERHFEVVRELVRQGTSDPLGLAVSSFGEEARTAWEAGDLEKAVDLYARQASYGSTSGETSLLILAGWILKDPKLLDRAVRNAMARRLIFLSVNKNSSSLYSAGSEAERLADSTVDRIADALAKNGIAHAPGADLLASGAYQHGRFDLAEKLCAFDNSPLSAWTAAKLALRKGDQKVARKYYDQALKVVAEPDSAALHAEIAILRVSRGDYVQALDTFYKASGDDKNQTEEGLGFTDYWGDAAYLAERVLTLSELRSFVDSNVKSQHSHLRHLLARRLMRAGMYREALPYFDDPKIRTAASQYWAALGAASQWWRSKTARAEAWFTAAKIARKNGMEILGFERDPDYAMWNGVFGNWNADVRKPPSPYQSEEERLRVAASGPTVNRRFHYRYIAMEEAKRSADLLPSRSQAFAAVLCEGARWVIDQEPKDATQVYRRYIREGAYVSWGNSFGRQCPAPDFAAASKSGALAYTWHSLKRHIEAHPWIGFSATLAVLGFAFLMVRRSSGKLSMPNALGRN